MNNRINPFLNFILFVRRTFREDKQKFKNDFLESKLYTKYTQNKKKFILSRVGILIAIIIVFLLLLQFNTFMNYRESLKGPIAKRLKISDGIYYSGEIENSLINGNGKLTIETKKYFLQLEGDFKVDNFEELKTSKNKDIVIGKFINGEISINDKESDIDYYWNGSFDNFALKTGTLTIKKPYSKTTYEGTFVNGKLQGIGSITSYKDGKEMFLEGYFEDGKYQELTEKVDMLPDSNEPKVVEQSKSEEQIEEVVYNGKRVILERESQPIENDISFTLDEEQMAMEESQEVVEESTSEENIEETSSTEIEEEVESIEEENNVDDVLRR